MKDILDNWREYSKKALIEESISFKSAMLLYEGMRQPDELPENVYITIQTENMKLNNGKSSKDIYIFYSDDQGRWLQPEDSEITGQIYIVPRNLKLDGQCLGAMVVQNTYKTTHGWGPLLYDIAIEWASLQSVGLMPDRNDVTSEAAAVWNYYLNNRAELTIHQLDNPEDELTPGVPEDNCAQDSAEEWAEIHGTSWEKSPLSKVYSKKPDTIEKLKNLNKLIVNDFEQ